MFSKLIIRHPNSIPSLSALNMLLAAGVVSEATTQRNPEKITQFTLSGIFKGIYDFPIIYLIYLSSTKNDNIKNSSTR